MKKEKVIGGNHSIKAKGQCYSSTGENGEPIILCVGVMPYIKYQEMKMVGEVHDVLSDGFCGFNSPIMGLAKLGFKADERPVNHLSLRKYPGPPSLGQNHATSPQFAVSASSPWLPVPWFWLSCPALQVFSWVQCVCVGWYT
jgi:hypothetical protein